MDGESPVVCRFLKVLMPGFETGLKLPPAFNRRLKNMDLNSKRAVLKSCKGSWKVEVKKCDHGLLHFLGERWEGYVSEHDLKEGEFIVFEHKGHLRFNTFMFDESGCEKDFATWEEDTSEDDVDECPEHIAVAGGSKQNVNSQFQMTLTSSNFRGFINVPAEFARSNGMCQEGTVTLRDATGDSWLAKLNVTTEYRGNRVSTKSRVRIKGLSRFFKDNRLKNGDTCIFELNDHSSENPKHFVMNVLFLRE